jgi:hypothetical protein
VTNRSNYNARSSGSTATKPKIKFIHLRKFTDEGAISSNGGITVAYQVHEDEVIFAIAWCHHKDNFVKSLGRLKATAMLLRSVNKRYSIPAEKGEKNSVTVERIKAEVVGINHERMLRSRERLRQE